jgi:DNA replication protein DnaC
VTRAELEKAIAAIGRPTPFMGSERHRGMRSVVEVMHNVQRSLRELREWDAAFPDQAAEHHRLVDELDALERREKVTEQSLKLAARAVSVLEQSGAGERSMRAAAAPQVTQALDAAQVWMGEQPPRWALVLRGPVGTGKTVAACWAMRRAALTGEDVAFRKAGEVARMSGFDAGAAELKALKRVGLLVLDDVGAEQLNEWGRALMVELLDARYEATARTVITANPDWKKLEERLGQRIVDRLRDGGRVVELAGKSMRGAA